MSNASGSVSASVSTGPSQNDPILDSGFGFVEEGTDWSDKPPTNRDGRGEGDKKIKGVIIGDGGKKVKPADK
ncbi:hypothetical protein H1R20_g3176, partial [Candolleomyces eurysporus]